MSDKHWNQMFDNWFDKREKQLEAEYLDYMIDEVHTDDGMIEAIESDHFMEWCVDRFHVWCETTSME